MWASGARSPDAPTEPCDGTYGTRPALCTATSVSITTSRTPECPRARLAAFSASISRTTSGASGCADADAVRADQVQLQLVELALADALVGELAEAGVHAVDRRVALRGALHHGRAGEDAGARRGVDGERHAAGVNRLQVLERELARDDVQRSLHHRTMGRFSPCSRAQATAMS